MHRRQTDGMSEFRVSTATVTCFVRQRQAGEVDANGNKAQTSQASGLVSGSPFEVMAGGDVSVFCGSGFENRM